MGYRIDAVGEPDIDHAFMNIGDLSGVLALDAALLQVVPVSVFRSALDVGPDAQVLQAVAPYTEDICIWMEKCGSCCRSIWEKFLK